MTELTLTRRFVNWLRDLFIKKEKVQENSNKLKREMCRKAIQGGVCPHACDICAWNILTESEEV